MAVATDLSLAPEVVEKDYVLGWVLAGIYADERLARNWVFKGGTCLKKCYFETYRFSEDLDFTVLDPVHLEEGFLKAAFGDVARWVLDASGVELPVELLRFEVYKNKRGGLSCQGRVSYRGPLRRGGDLQRVKLDLTIDEKIVLPPVDRPVGHPYSDQPESGMSARCYAFEELLAEKTRALAERTRPRDLYDVVNLFRMDEVRPPAAVVADVLRQKCEFKNIAVPEHGKIAGAEVELRADWEAMLGHQLPALPPFELFWKALPEYFEWLATGNVAQAPTPLPLAAGQATFRPSMGDLRRAGIGRSSHLETIRFAGANRLCVELAYQGSTRIIEPYSLRRTSEGAVLLMAARADTGESRSYRVDRIQGVRVTDRAFAPRYAVELTASEASIPELTRTASPTSIRPLREPARSSTRVRSSGLGPVYIFECGLCGKKFRRSSYDSHLNPHKNPDGWDCPGRTGFYVDTRY